MCLGRRVRESSLVLTQTRISVSIIIIILVVLHSLENASFDGYIFVVASIIRDLYQKYVYYLWVQYQTNAGVSNIS